MRSIVRQVDHLLIESAKPEELFALLSETLALPVTWPMAEHVGFKSGGVSAGNVNLEVLAPMGPPSTPVRLHGIAFDPSPLTEALALPATWPMAEHVGFKSGGVSAGNVNLEVLAPMGPPWTPVRLHGIAFDPSPLTEALAELDARDLPHSGLVPYRAPGAQEGEPLWTWVHFPHWGDSLVFLCAYRPDAHTKDSRRVALDARGGGTLGLAGVTEVTVGAAQFEEAVDYWARLLAPAPSAARGVWQAGEGPAIRLVAHDRNTLLVITLAVASLDSARKAIEGAGLTVHDGDGGLQLAGELVEGLDIRLVEA
jgi:hypothetical protein